MTEVTHERRKSRTRGREGRYKMLRGMYFAEFFEAIIAAIIVAAFLRIFIVSVYRIPTDSMAPALIPGDFIVAMKNSYGVPIPWSDTKIGAVEPKRGDVVIFHLPNDETLFVKRIVGVAGDKIEIRDGDLVVNDVGTSVRQSSDADWEFREEVADGTTRRVMRRKASEEADFLAPLIVPPGQVFLLGDFRSESADSRQWGPLPTSLISARVSFIAFSMQINDVTSNLPASIKDQPRLARAFKSIE